MKISSLIAALTLDGVDRITISKFVKYHKANRWIWVWFQKYTFEAIGKGKQVGAKAVWERCRWEAPVKSGKSFKCNNNFPAYYARAFSLQHPRYSGFFKKRKIKGLRQAA